MGGVKGGVKGPTEDPDEVRDIIASPAGGASKVLFSAKRTCFAFIVNALDTEGGDN